MRALYPQLGIPPSKFDGRRQLPREVLQDVSVVKKKSVPVRKATLVSPDCVRLEDLIASFLIGACIAHVWAISSCHLLMAAGKTC